MDKGLHIFWSPVYRAEWDDMPEQYVIHGVVAWGRSRRLARCSDPALRFKAYLGVQHYDPRRWYGSGEAVAKFFLSMFFESRTLALQTFPTMSPALELLHEYHQKLSHNQAGPEAHL